MPHFNQSQNTGTRPISPATGPVTPGTKLSSHYSTNFQPLVWVHEVCWLVGCSTSQQQASVSQGQICSDNFTCCHTEVEAADPTFYLTLSKYTDTSLTSPSADPITPGIWQGSHWSANFEVTGMTRPGKIPSPAGFELLIYRPSAGWAQRTRHPRFLSRFQQSGKWIYFFQRKKERWEEAWVKLRLCRRSIFSVIREALDCRLLNVLATCKCISRARLFRLVCVQPHWDSGSKSNAPFQPVTKYWYHANQSYHWPCNAGHQAE